MSGPEILYTVLPQVSGSNKRSSCRGCIYRRAIGGGRGNYTVCHYLHDTGKPRGCPADHCDKKILKKRGLRNG